MTTPFPELGAYMLPGHIFDPREAIAETKAADALGLGSIWVSERFSAKNCDVLSGAAAMLSDRMGIAAGLMQNMPLRHPIVTAGYCATMAKLTGDRFALGVGRGTPTFADATGTPRVTFQVMGDYIDILRRLWRNETVDYEGPLGSYKGLRLGVEMDKAPPVMIATMGDKTLEWAGARADAVILNSLWTPQAVERSAALIRKGAEEAGRDPDTIRIWTILMTACDVPEEKYLSWIIRRINTYLMFPPMFDGICDGNGWDKSLAPKLRAALAELDGPPVDGTMGDEATTRDFDKLRRMADLYPREWTEQGCAVGTGADGAKAIGDRINAGAHSVLFHGSHPQNLDSVVAHWRAIRPAHLDALSPNPGF